MRVRAAIALVVLIASGCAVGPRYQRPTVNTPPSFRGLPDSETNSAAQQSLGAEPWSSVFPDEALQTLIRTALAQNYDLQIAAQRIVEARASLGITRADQFPNVEGSAQFTSTRTPQSEFPAFTIAEGGPAVTASWEPDFWRKYRSASDAARANLLGAQWARQAVVSSLVADLATAYFQLRELDMELDLSRQTMASRQDSLQLTQLLADRGLRSEVDVREAEQLVYTASETIPDLERRIQQQENLISILTGNNPGPVARGRALTEQPVAPTVPAGLPSQLLERRPDIHQAEDQLMAMNAEIGAVRAAVFPSIVLTVTGGFESSSLLDLFSGPAGLWNFAGNLTQPLFSHGKLRAGIELTEAQQQEALLTYKSTVQQAFRDVSDALIAYTKNQQFRAQQELLLGSSQESARLSNIRYRGGVANYLEVETAETNAFAAQRGLVQAQLNERLALVQLYEALGGGWQP